MYNPYNPYSHNSEQQMLDMFMKTEFAMKTHGDYEKTMADAFANFKSNLSTPPNVLTKEEGNDIKKQLADITKMLENLNTGGTQNAQNFKKN